MRLKTFGALALVRDGAIVEGTRLQRRQLALLAVLAAGGAGGAGGVAREELLSIFWPDKEPELARQSLSQALTSSRRALGEEVVLESAKALHLNAASLPSDVADFSRALQAGDRAAAVAVYAGPFLESVYLTNAPEFERWAERTRAEIRSAFVQALLALAAADAGKGRYASAVGHLRRAAAEEPLSVPVACALLRTLYEAGQPAAAVEWARVHAAIVMESLGTEPDGAVLRVMEDGRAGRIPASPLAITDSGAGAASAPPAAPPAAAAAESGPSLAVPPFAAISADPADRYLADGMTEAVIDALTPNSGIRVVPFRTVAALAVGGGEMREVGRRLGVQLVLEGTVQKALKRVRVSVTLIRVSDGASLWTAMFQRELDDVIALQADIARAIAEQLRLSVVASSRPSAGAVRTEAYERFRAGCHFREKRSPDGLVRAVKYFREAQAIEPEYADSHAGEAGALAVLGAFDAMPAHEVMPRAREAARRALALDANLSEPHAVLGAVAALYDWDWPAAIREFDLALAIDPHDQIARMWHANYVLAPLGRLDEALASMRRALRADQLSPIINTSTGMLLTFARRYDEAAAQLRTVLDLDPNFLLATYFLGRSETERGHHGAAIASLERAVALSGGNAVAIAALAHAHARAGDAAEARALLQRLDDLSAGAWVSSFQRAIVHAGLDDADAALDALERAATERSSFMAWLAVQPGLDDLRGHARYRALLRQVRIPDGAAPGNDAGEREGRLP